jgi:hypothetical protein
LHHEPAPLGQSVEGRLEARGRLGRFHCHVGWRSGVAECIVRRFVPIALEALPFAQVERAVSRRGEEVRPERGADVPLAAARPEIGEQVLDDFLRQRALADVAEDEGAEWGVVCAENRFERAGVAAADAGGEDGVEGRFVAQALFFRTMNSTSQSSTCSSAST